MNHSWGENRILTFLPEARQLHQAILNKDKSVAFPAPRFISCWISEKCNLDCTYCYFSETNHDKSHLYIDTHKFLGWLAQVREFGAEALEFSGGGEPTLHPDFRMIYEHAKNMLGFQIGIITHACNDIPLDSMAQHFSYVRCGLDAATVETHDAIKRNKRKNYWFHKAIENIKELTRLRDLYKTKAFTVGIKIVLNTINAHELPKMIELAQNLRVDYIQIKCEHSSDNAIDMNELPALQAIIDREPWNGVTRVSGTVYHNRASVKCFMSPIHTVVTATGKILQCCFFENRPIGTINQPFNEAWGSDAHRKVIEMTTIPECDKVDCRWHFYNRRMKDVIEDPLHSASFI